MSALHSLRAGATRSVRSCQCIATRPNALVLSSARQPLTVSMAYTPGRRTIIYLPVVLQAAFWKSLVPSFLRRSSEADRVPIRRRPWNPATYFIWMFMLIGSQAIQMITLKSGFDKFSRETEQRLELLRDVVRRLQAGEDVDVEKELGTGDPARERQWDEVMEELAQEDAMFQAKRKQRQSQKTEPKP